MAIGDEVAVPENVLVRCPMRNSVFIRARTCEPCKHFAGLTQAFNNPNLPFERRFFVRCAFPRDLELAALQEKAE